MKTIIAGSRLPFGKPDPKLNYAEQAAQQLYLTYKTVVAVEAAIHYAAIPITQVISGMAQGVDLIAWQWAGQHKIDRVAMPAEWDINGRSAGFIRNSEMAEVADALIAVWDGQSKGTAHMIQQAMRKNLRIYIYRTDQQ